MNLWGLRQIKEMKRTIRIGTRDSQLAMWQATRVQQLLQENGYASELVGIKSEGDIDLKTPLYEIGVQGIFTRSLDIALLNGNVDLAVHSMKDVPTRLPNGIVQTAILERASYKDIFVYKGDISWIDDLAAIGIVGTSSVRRRAQWLHRYPNFEIENLRGNMLKRLQKLAESNWNGAIFAAAGLDRIDLRPQESIELDWMLPAPSQGAIMVVGRENDDFCKEACLPFNHVPTAICTKQEKDFLRELMGGCSTPISALAQIEGDQLLFKGNIFSLDGKQRVDVAKTVALDNIGNIGKEAAFELLANGGQAIVDAIQK